LGWIGEICGTDGSNWPALGKDDRQALDDCKEREERKRNKKAPFPFSLTLPFLYLLKNKEKERRERKAGGHRRGDLKGGTWNTRKTRASTSEKPAGQFPLSKRLLCRC